MIDDPYPPTIVEDADAFWRWVNNADPCEQCEYFGGKSICIETGRAEKSGYKTYERVPTAEAAFQAYELGLVTLVQKRNHIGDPFTWIAIKRKQKV